MFGSVLKPVPLFLPSFIGRLNVKQEEIDDMLKEAPGPINFTVFLTMFGEKLKGEGFVLYSLGSDHTVYPDNYPKTFRTMAIASLKQRSCAVGAEVNLCNPFLHPSVSRVSLSSRLKFLNTWEPRSTPTCRLRIRPTRCTKKHNSASTC